MWATAFTVASLGRNGQGMVSRLGLASLSNFSDLWGMGAVPSCFVPSYEVAGADG